MITKEQALEIVKKYINQRKRQFISISSSDKIIKKDQIKIPYGKYEGKIKDVYVVNYDIEGYTEPTPYFVYLECEKGEVLFTITPHGYAEDWEG
jgi:hypothetical protein